MSQITFAAVACGDAVERMAGRGRLRQVRAPAIGERPPYWFRGKRRSGFWGCAPASEEVERLGCAASHLGGEDGEPEPVIGQLHDLVVELEFADEGVPEARASRLAPTPWRRSRRKPTPS